MMFSPFAITSDLAVSTFTTTPFSSSFAFFSFGLLISAELCLISELDALEEELLDSFDVLESLFDEISELDESELSDALDESELSAALAEVEEFDELETSDELDEELEELEFCFEKLDDSEEDAEEEDEEEDESVLKSRPLRTSSPF
mmetsp:Transcript_7555/g.13678  ORF Transcript_7555/g.13678 Transcript_7555/m.13678 type:complete len:147 (+) Transcript_7555:436-876(+)